MDILFMKDYYDLRYEETDGENHFVDEAAYQEKPVSYTHLLWMAVAVLPIITEEVFCFAIMTMTGKCDSHGRQWISG